MTGWRLKENVPQAVRDLEAEPETISVVEKAGRQIAQASWRDVVFEEALPHGCETWEPDEIKSVMKNAARRLKVKVGKAKWEAMAELAAALTPEAAPRELTDLDHARMLRAQEKRQRRAAKRAERHA